MYPVKIYHSFYIYQKYEKWDTATYNASNDPIYCDVINVFRYTVGSVVYAKQTFNCADYIKENTNNHKQIDPN